MSRVGRIRWALMVAALVSLTAGGALAQEYYEQDLLPPPRPGNTFGDALLRARFERVGAWNTGPTRWFLATRTDLGILYLRPRVSLGYGKPHFRWIGVDLNPIVSSHGMGSYGGIRLAHPHVDLRVGARNWYAFRQSLLQPKHSYEHLVLYSRQGPRARYVSLEAELTYDIPLGPGSILGEMSATHVSIPEEGYFVYEETLNVIVDPPSVYRARLGYGWAFGYRKAIRFAPLVETAIVPGRDLHVYRFGAQASLRLNTPLLVRVFAFPLILSRDQVGADGADAFGVGLRHYWATPPSRRSKKR